jgi:uncharacterized protein YqhQ
MASADVAARGEGMEPLKPIHYGFSIAIALAIAIGGFVVAPSAVIERLHLHSIVLNLIEGAIRFVFFVAFLLMVSRMPDMRRVFQYHGAEHKVINTYETTGRYEARDTEEFETFHQRCGTSFIFMVLFVGILVHAVMGWPALHWRILSRLVVLPVIAGVSYELVKLAGARRSSLLLRFLVAPGMWLQRITTRPPTPDQIEVAISALDGALELDGVKASA